MPDLAGPEDVNNGGVLSMLKKASVIFAGVFLLLAFGWIFRDEATSLIAILASTGIAALLVLAQMRSSHEPTHYGTLQNGTEQWQKVREWGKSRR